jgi:tetratricopeptide (TPR) repeat protein
MFPSKGFRSGESASQAKGDPAVSPPASRRLVPFLIAGLTALVFAPSLRSDFVNWDDPYLLTLNPHYRGLSRAHLQWMFTTFHMGHYQPLSWVTFGLDYLIWGMNPFGYHLTNLLFHAANAALFYLLSLILLGRCFAEESRAGGAALKLGAAFSALFFSLHPLRVESVVWITERRDVLSSFFLLAALLCYLRAAQGWRPKFFMAASMTLYGFSLFSKAAGITLPAVLLLLDWYPLRRIPANPKKWLDGGARKVWLEKLFFLAMAAPFALLALMAQREAMALLSAERHGLPARLAQALYGLAFYPWKTLFPFEMSPLYEIPAHISLRSPPFLWSGVIVAGLTVGLVASARRWPAGLATWAGYVVMVSPVLGLAQSGPQLVADRYSYLSCLGWALLGGGGLSCLWPLQGRAALRLGTIVAVGGFALIVLTCLGFLTYKQSMVWRGTEALWRHALTLDPESKYAHYNLGRFLWKEGREEEAIAHYGQALASSPRFEDAHFSLATALAKKGELDKAMEHLEAAIAIDPKFAEARSNLGEALAWRGEVEKAKDQFEKALETRPDLAGAHYGLGRILAGEGRLAEGERHLREAIRHKPDLAPAYGALGVLLASRGDLDAAVESFRAALRIEPSLVEVERDLAEALAQRRKLTGGS